MREHEKYHVVYHEKQNELLVTPYSATAKKYAGEKGLTVHTFSRGHRAFGEVSALWAKHMAKAMPNHPAPGASPLAGDSPTMGVQGLEAKAKAEWDKDPKLRAEFGGRFELYLVEQRKIESGNIVLSARERQKQIGASIP